MYEGLQILGGIDLAIAALALWLARSRWLLGGDTKDLAILAVVLVGAGTAHWVGLQAFAVRTLEAQGGSDPDAGTKMLVLAGNVATGVIPTGLLAYVTIHKLINIFSAPQKAPERFPLATLSRVKQKAASGDIAGALGDCDRCARRYPNAAGPLFLAAEFLQQRGRNQDAAVYLRRITQTLRRDNEVFLRAGLNLARLLDGPLNRKAEADSLREDLARREANAPKADFDADAIARSGINVLDRARSLARAGDTDKAIAVYRAHCRNQPHQTRPLLEIAGILERESRYEEAVEVHRELMRAFPEDDAVWSEAALRLANLLEVQLGEPEAARYIWTQVQQRMPDSKYGRDARIRLYGEKEGM